MLGIDVSKDHLACALYERPTQQFRWEKALPNTPAGVAQLLQLTPPEVPWILEPTGRYSLSVAQQARQAGRVVLLASPRKAKAYLQSITSRAKTDRLDSRGLALFAASRTAADPLPLYPIKSARVEQLDQLLTARRGIVAALTSLQQQLAELPHAAGPLRQAVADLQARRQELEQQIAQLTQADEAVPAARKLRPVPGIGPVIAATAASRLTARSFPSGDHFVAYIGLDIGIVQSGKRKGTRGLTKQGDAELRRLFYLAAQANLRSRQSPFRQQYERELAKGLSKTAALNAVARKLARLCWSLVTHDSEYDPERVFRPATPPRSGSEASGAPAAAPHTPKAPGGPALPDPPPPVSPLASELQA